MTIQRQYAPSTAVEDSTQAHNSAPYLSLAGMLYDGRFGEDDLPAALIQLPTLDEECLYKLAQIAQQASLTQPRRGWALMAVADAMAQQSNDLFLQSLAAWYLGRAANDWVRPQRVQAAIGRARRGFRQLNERGWLAACEWQLYAVPWLWPDFRGSVTKLEKALAGLQEADFTKFVAACRLSLAFATLLIGDFTTAAAQTEKAERTWQAAHDQFGIGRCLYTKASYQRRRSRLEPALTNTRRALDIFQQLGATVYVAIAQYGLGHVVRVSQGNFAAAEAHFREAAALFAGCDLPLWVAQCRGGLAQVFTYRGQLRQADQALRRARQVYERYRVPGLWADNLLDSGQLALFKGQYKNSLSFLERAEVLYRETGNQWMPIVALMDQGETCLQQGRYHEALRRLEKAHDSLQQRDLPHRQAECEWRLAHAWLHLGHSERAHAFLDKATVHYEQAKHLGSLVDVYNRRAEIYLLEHQWDEAIPLLQEVINVALRQGATAQTALSQRLLGETLWAAGRTEEALSYLRESRQYFANEGMVSEEAACELVLGRYYQQKNDERAATTAWRRALALSEGTVPEIEWQAQAALAEIAIAPETALEHYRQALAALARLRQNLWQPSLAGSLLKRPAAMIDRAVSLAAREHAVTDALFFIEESKAQTIVRQLPGNVETISNVPEALTDLVAEIRWLQQELRKTGKPNFLAAMTARELNRAFIEKVKAYDTAVSQLERASLTNPAATNSPHLNMGLFRQEANAQLGKKWLALDYYYTEEAVYVVMIGPDDDDIWYQELTSTAHFALGLITKERVGRFWSGDDLARLGHFLFPPAANERLTPDTCLLIAPHRRLHRLPWAALPYGPQAPPLVAGCIPVVVPSLQSLLFLWQRQSARKATGRSGLVVAVPDFQGRHKPLPAVMREGEKLQSLPGWRMQFLTGNEVSLATLSQLSAEGYLSQFAFIHIATHAFSDQLTGRLSGLALYDEDLWLDELMQLAPMPSLVTLSACSGLRGLLYEGDEHVGIAVTCLVAGAQTVIGSLWPILDQPTPDLMYDFYRHLLANRSSALALALAQRAALAAGVDARHWGGFQCVGRP